MERLGGCGRKRASHNLQLPRAVASRLRPWRSRYHETLRPRNRADFARHNAVIGGADRALCRPVDAAGLLGLVGFLMTFLGNVLVAGAVWEATFVVPWLAWEAPDLLDEGLHGG